MGRCLCRVWLRMSPGNASAATVCRTSPRAPFSTEIASFVNARTMTTRLLRQVTVTTGSPCQYNSQCLRLTDCTAMPELCPRPRNTTRDSGSSISHGVDLEAGRRTIISFSMAGHPLASSGAYAHPVHSVGCSWISCRSRWPGEDVSAQGIDHRYIYIINRSRFGEGAALPQ